MVSSLEFRFDPNDAAGREKARKKFLRTVLDRARKVHAVIVKLQAEDAVLDLLLLQNVYARFQDVNWAGNAICDPNMKRAVVGPIGLLLHSFDGIKEQRIANFENALRECEE